MMSPIGKPGVAPVLAPRRCAVFAHLNPDREEPPR